MATVVVSGYNYNDNDSDDDNDMWWCNTGG